VLDVPVLDTSVLDIPVLDIPVEANLNPPMLVCVDCFVLGSSHGSRLGDLPRPEDGSGTDRKLSRRAGKASREYRVARGLVMPARCLAFAADLRDHVVAIEAPDWMPAEAKSMARHQAAAVTEATGQLRLRTQLLQGAPSALPFDVGHGWRGVLIFEVFLLTIAMLVDPKRTDLHSGPMLMRSGTMGLLCSYCFARRGRISEPILSAQLQCGVAKVVIAQKGCSGANAALQDEAVDLVVAG